MEKKHTFSMLFFQIMNFVNHGNDPTSFYNLNSNNCTTFVINALNAASVNVPITIGSWTDGSGEDPGDFGEDIRTMRLTSAMTRNTVYNDHPNMGTCY